MPSDVKVNIKTYQSLSNNEHFLSNITLPNDVFTCVEIRRLDFGTQQPDER